ncbi:MAG: hypothetical protein PGN15_12230 [Aeromicrobium erythreum]
MPRGTTVATVEQARRSSRGRRLVAGLALLAWPVGPWLGALAFVSSLTLMGEPPDADDRRRADLFLLACAVVSTGLPALALVLARDVRVLRVLGVVLLAVTALLVPVLVVLVG